MKRYLGVIVLFVVLLVGCNGTNIEVETVVSGEALEKVIQEKEQLQLLLEEAYDRIQVLEKIEIRLEESKKDIAELQENLNEMVKIKSNIDKLVGEHNIKSETLKIETYLPCGMPLDKVKWKDSHGYAYEEYLSNDGYGFDGTIIYTN